MLNDWYDGNVDRTYPLRCYHQAIAHLSTEAQLYSSARDILRALQRAVLHKPPIKRHVAPTGPLASGGAALPLPILILIGLVAALVLAGLGGLAWRQYQARRGTP
jgi:hypothetical protein